MVKKKNFLISNMRVEKLIAKLKAIASIKAGDRWCTYSEQPQRAGFITSLSRTIWYVEEEKNLNLADIENTVETAWQMLKEMELDNEQTRNLLEALLEARDGIHNLRVVYHEYESIIYKIRLLLDKINERAETYSIINI